MSGTIRKRRGWVALPNSTALDGGLSYRALGLLVAMLARPDGSSFDMRMFAADDLRRPGREGRAALLRAAAELRGRGYVHTFTVTQAGTKGVHSQTIVDAEPMTRAQAAQALEVRRKRPRKAAASGVQKPDPTVSAPVGSGQRTPMQCTPIHSTPLPTEGHSESLRSQRQRTKDGPSALPCPSCGDPVVKTHRCRATGQPVPPPPGLLAQIEATPHVPPQPQLPLDAVACLGCGSTDRPVIAPDGLCTRCLVEQHKPKHSTEGNPA